MPEGYDPGLDEPIDYEGAGWDPEKDNIYDQIEEALGSYNDDSGLVLAEKLLQANPEYLRMYGRDNHLDTAAALGRLDLVKMLVRLGIGIDEVSFQNYKPEDTPNARIEGAIVDAAAEGHLDIVKWFIEQGAKLNYTVYGKSRCLALNKAVDNEHVEVAKLLVENGAEINSIVDGRNPLMIAMFHENEELIDYFRSLGQRPLYETTPRDFDGSRQTYLERSEDFFGPAKKLDVKLPVNSSVDLYVSVPSSEWIEKELEWADEVSGTRTIFTVGLCEHEFHGNNFVPRFTAEFFFKVQDSWNLSKANLENELGWLINGIDQLLSYMKSREELPEISDYIVWNGTPPMPIMDDTKMCAWLCSPSSRFNALMPDYRHGYFHEIIPLFQEEAALITDPTELYYFEQRWEAAELPEFMTTDRMNLVTEFTCDLEGAEDE